MLPNSSDRINWIDNARLIGIYLVVLGHTSIPKEPVNFIYAFHMPLFFFISGFIFNPSKFSSQFDFVKRRSKQLIIPYFGFSIITYLFWYFIGRKFGNDATEQISPLTPLKGIFYATDTNNYLIHCGSLWFLPCLYLTEIVFFSIYNKISKWAFIFILLIINYTIHYFKTSLLPLSLNTLASSLIFYAFGFNFKKELNFVNTIPSKIKALVFMLLILFVYFSSNYFGRVDLSSDNYNNYAMFIINGLFGILMIIIVAQLISKKLAMPILLKTLSQNTLIILAFHEIVTSILKGVSLFIFKIPIETFKNNLYLNLILSLVCLLSLFPIIQILSKYMPILIGKTKTTLVNLF